MNTEDQPLLPGPDAREADVAPEGENMDANVDRDRRAGAASPDGQTDRLVPAIEAILFAGVDPVPLDRIAAALEVPLETAREAVDHLVRSLGGPDRGLEVVERGEGFQLVTKRAFSRQVAHLSDDPQAAPLSQAALETLAIIAYRQPITRTEIEGVRGVQSKSALDNLVARGLVVDRGRKDAPGRPVLWGTTREFLIAFGLANLDDLPALRIEPIDESPRAIG